MWGRNVLLRPPAVRWATGRAALSTFRTRQNPRGRQSPLRRIQPTQGRSSGPSSSSHQQPQSEAHNPEAREASGFNPDYNPAQNTLLAPVHIPEDPNGVLRADHPATNILANSGLVVQRQLEMMNVMIGFEQANRYVIMDAHGNHIGYMAEQEKGMANMMARQWFRTHRGFVTHVFDRHENEVLRFHRPFSWINSCIRVYDPLDSASLQTNSPGGGSLGQMIDGSNVRVSPLQLEDMRVIGEAQQQWAPLRRKYNLFTYHQAPNSANDMGTGQLSHSEVNVSPTQQLQLSTTSKHGRDMGEFQQFAYVDEPFLSWDFSLRSAEGRPIGSVNRNFVGFAREIFTDTGVYALRMDSANEGSGASVAVPGDRVAGMTLDQRAVILASAVSIDFDYFSRHSDGGGVGFLPFFPMSGETAAGGAAAGEAAGAGAGAGEAGAVGGAAAGTAGRAGAAGGGMADGAAAGAAGAGTVAGYDAMQRGMSGESPQVPPSEQQQQPSQTANPYDDVWAEERGQNQDQGPWARNTDDGWDIDGSSEEGEDGGSDDFDFF